MAKIEDIERRLLNWARWKEMTGSGGLGYAAVQLEAEGGRNGYREATVPVLDCDASEMDGLVQRLPGYLRATVIDYYTLPGGDVTRTERLVCSRTALYARIERAHILLARGLADKHQIRVAERDRVERLQREGVKRGF